MVRNRSRPPPTLGRWGQTRVRPRPQVVATPVFSSALVLQRHRPSRGGLRPPPFTLRRASFSGAGHMSIGPRFVLQIFRNVCAAIAAMAVSAHAATLPAGFTESLVASGLSTPTAMQFAPDGRLFVCEQSGRLRVIKNGTLLSTPFLTVTVSSSGERGLLGVAFDPDFAVNQFVYVYYTATSPTIHNRVSRFTANGDVAAAGSEVILLDLENLSATN